MDNLFKETKVDVAKLTQAQKDANDKQWYKDKANQYDTRTYSSRTNVFGADEVPRHKAKQINYDLFNNIINIEDFRYVCQPFGEGAELPANFTNRDIVSSKLKVMLGMESDMPFSWRVFAVNEEATTRKEQETFAQVREFTVNSILGPIRQEIEMRQMAEAQGRELTPDEKKQFQAQMEEEMKVRTPDEVNKYMQREHQDPAEILAHQLLQYLMQKERVKEKFSKGFKHGILSGDMVYFVGILNGEPVLKVINPLRFECDKSRDLDYIQDGEWALCEYRMTPTEVMKNFGTELKDEEIEKVYSKEFPGNSDINSGYEFGQYDEAEPFTIRVLHINFMSLRKIGFLTYMSPETGQPEEMIVPDSYKFDKNRGDISIEWKWIPEAHEVYKIGDDIYCYARPVPGQHQDMNDLYSSKLSYYGAFLDDLNSIPTAPMDRIKNYQYIYDVIIYRTELLMASDKGKKILMNIKAIPASSGIDIKKWMYFFEANNIAWFDPSEEGNRGDPSAGSIAKDIDMSLASQINNYIALADYIERRAGETIGVPKSMEGITAPTESVGNNRQNIVQSSYILRPYYDLQNAVKGQVLQGLIDVAKVAYAGKGRLKLPYVLDDMSIQMLDLDTELLSNSRYGLFMANNSSAYDAKQMIMQASQAAIQNQRADISDFIKVMGTDSIHEAQEILEAAQMKKDNMMAQQQQQQLQAQAEQAQIERAEIERIEDKKHQHKMEEIRLKGEFDLQRQAMLSMGFNEDKDMDSDGTPDVFEIYKEGIKAQISMAKLNLDKRKQDHQENTDRKKLEQADKKLEIDKKKAAQKSLSQN